MVWVCTPCPAHLSLQQNVLKVTEQEDGRGGVYTQDCEERGMRAGLGQTSSSGGPGDWSEGAPVWPLRAPREVLAFGVSWLSPCRRASKKIRKPAALAKVLGEGKRQVCEGSGRPCQVPGPALSSPCHSHSSHHPPPPSDWPPHSPTLPTPSPAPNIPRNPTCLPGFPWGFCNFLKVQSNELFWAFPAEKPHLCHQIGCGS